MKQLISLFVIGTACAALFAAEPVSAATNCVFKKTTRSMVLQGSCSTDETIFIPKNSTLVGGGFKITAIDPEGGNFRGPIISNAGTTANVSNLYIRTNLQDVCNEGADKVVGILLADAAGSISGVNITIAKGTGGSACDEGIAIQAYKLPFSRTGVYRKVTIKNSLLNYNQLGAVLAQGNVNVRVDTNTIKSAGDDPNIAQRAVEINSGAKGYVVSNTIVRFSHVPLNNSPAFGVLLNGAGATLVDKNTLSYNDIGVFINGGSRLSVTNNTIRSSALDGILVDDSLGVPTTSVTISGNDSSKNTLNGINLQSLNGLLTKNLIKSNITSRNIQSGIVAEGSSNKLQKNTSTLNSSLDMADFGSGNLYSKNICDTSTGAPVDCPATAK